MNSAKRVESLLKVVEAGDEKARRDAVRELCALDPKTDEVLLALVRVRTEASYVDAVAAKNAIRNLGPAVIPRLLRILRDTRELGEIRRSAAQCLPELGPVALPALLELIASSDDWECDVAIEVFPRMGQLADTCVPQLLTVLERRQWMETGSLTLAQIANRCSRPKESQSFGSLLALFKSEKPSDRLNAIHACEFLSDHAELVIPLLQHATDDPDEEVRKEASFYLLRLIDAQKTRGTFTG